MCCTNFQVDDRYISCKLYQDISPSIPNVVIFHKPKQSRDRFGKKERADFPLQHHQ
ncbi:hypothetical protein D3C86_1440250 [compost metagenome]